MLIHRQKAILLANWLMPIVAPFRPSLPHFLLEHKDCSYTETLFIVFALTGSTRVGILSQPQVTLVQALLQRGKEIGLVIRRILAVVFHIVRQRNTKAIEDKYLINLQNILSQN